MTHDKPDRILIVENESLIGWSLMNAFRKAGYDSDVVDSAEQAVRNWEEENYDLVIGDIQLLKMDELFILGTEKSFPKHTPVIIIGTREDITRRESESGPLVDYYLEKPFNVQEMLALVRVVLESVRSEKPDQN